MEYIQESLFPYLRAHSYTLLKKTISTLPASATAHLTTLRSAYLEPYLVQPLASLLSLSSSDLVSVAIMLLALYISLRILDYARRVVMFWVMFVVRLCFWAGVLGVGVYVYNVGVERAVTEAGWIWGVVQGFIEDFVADVEGKGQPRAAGYAYQNQRGGRRRW
ncbi:nuclear pore assembly and biogenesis-domain-containing protein [Talaromyces proteolyticus]|uniref:Nuclear pore assembly and biogenesis-domain-containing protein n=1 Tax=Talaromyces proteolyticus TaxID=1131652 RepID=A0AAD4KUY8_9EURO|nr:nuclear pore assembly and biogenesis-domain-containing protein [Talaromyces proteolyticus]KAH8697311.1 nuclear pore assembly and biogenesis-domain-containing protein [Talaromyces proteolyticus]